ncbi:reverse transcriptase domain-containing protein [Obesumbacterium proteus]|uniref:reverse transcriptase domain-containing protein n=1 Tax=Obesumbacterium proteus TaxID=82983 RepID=UPI001F348884|nr:reverse transcriptase domain-containing protein [Obesumbacterium proteus]MCE9884390.1 reverse transcriptase/maturase family protein [Obesumbacterium proteus]MCE9915962.1 reverse transcriptase/maturase family protein [Obesumbacterium proteus]MCE9928195.1 reverse transcriptase/maturase family protein [Obesumbacterium proteus]
MSVWSEFEKAFSIENLTRIYEENVRLSPATGIDNMTHEKFIYSRDEHINIINRKVMAGTYHFTKYKLKLISKGPKKYPREIAIPTIRDKIALRALCDFLKIRFNPVLDFSLPQEVIRDVKNSVYEKGYSGFIKLDISNFYPSIDHEKLLKRLNSRIRNEIIISLIKSAIETPTITRPTPKDKLSHIGVPQGLSISNILASIYLSNIDNYFKKIDNLTYFRYVDDILILCHTEKCNEIAEIAIRRFKKLKLKVHDPKTTPDKSSIGSLGVKDFTYLGYSFRSDCVSAREESINRLRESIISIFSGYKYSKIGSINFLEWRLNIRITGCIFQNKFKGWVFFFSEITNINLLHELDAFIQTLCKRYDVNIDVKSFIRTYYQANHKRHDSKYIPNFDKYTEKEMKHVLERYFNTKTTGLTSRQIKYNFLKRISRQVKDLETDVKDAGY